MAELLYFPHTPYPNCPANEFVVLTEQEDKDDEFYEQEYGHKPAERLRILGKIISLPTERILIPES